jgi:hypothetical protein
MTSNTPPVAISLSHHLPSLQENTVPTFVSNHIVAEESMRETCELKVILVMFIGSRAIRNAVKVEASIYQNIYSIIMRKMYK